MCPCIGTYGPKVTHDLSKRGKTAITTSVDAPCPLCLRYTLHFLFLRYLYPIYSWRELCGVHNELQRHTDGEIIPIQAVCGALQCEGDERHRRGK
jgi:hypothetical protein